MPRGGARLNAGRKPGSKSKHKATHGKRILLKRMLADAMAVSPIDKRELPAEFLLGIMHAEVPQDAAPQIQAATMHLKVEAGKALLPYFHYRKGEDKTIPPPPPVEIEDVEEISYDAARRIAYALSVVKPLAKDDEKR